MELVLLCDNKWVAYVQRAELNFPSTINGFTYSLFKQRCQAGIIIIVAVLK